MAKFKAGDRFRMNRFAGHAENIGKEGIVIGFSESDSVNFGCECYFADLNGPGNVAAEYSMDPLPPMRDDQEVARWADCPWQPERICVTADVL